MTNNFKIDFVGIGAPKSGTTWIYECLVEHPQICLAPKDQGDIAFFLQENPDVNKYINFFQEGCLRGDFHVGYLTDQQAARRMKDHNPDLKIIVCLRNPIERAYSHFRYLKFSKNKQWRSFYEAIKENPEILEPGFYYKHVSKFVELFGRDNVMILIYEDIKIDNKKFIQGVYKFLNVADDFVPFSIDLKINPTQFKMTKLGNFFHKRLARLFLKRTKWAWKVKRSILVKKFFCFLSERYAPSKKNIGISPLDSKKITDIYISDIKRLEKLINRDLHFWYEKRHI